MPYVIKIGTIEDLEEYKQQYTKRRHDKNAPDGTYHIITNIKKTFCHKNKNNLNPDTIIYSIENKPFSFYNIVKTTFNKILLDADDYVIKHLGGKGIDRVLISIPQ